MQLQNGEVRTPLESFYDTFKQSFLHSGHDSASIALQNAANKELHGIPCRYVAGLARRWSTDNTSPVASTYLLGNAWRSKRAKRPPAPLATTKLPSYTTESSRTLPNSGEQLERTPLHPRFGASAYYIPSKWLRGRARSAAVTDAAPDPDGRVLRKCS